MGLDKGESESRIALLGKVGKRRQGNIMHSGRRIARTTMTITEKRRTRQYRVQNGEKSEGSAHRDLGREKRNHSYTIYYVSRHAVTWRCRASKEGEKEVGLNSIS